MKTSTKLLSALLAAVNVLGWTDAANAQMRLTPTVVDGAARMVAYAYDPDKIYKVLVRPKNVTRIAFEADERVTYVSCGDQPTFNLTVPKSKEWVEIKPKFEGGSTNAFIKTTKREYHLDLTSYGEGQKWHTQVSWTYTDSVLYDATAAEVQGSAPVALRPVSADAMPFTASSQMPLVNPEQLSFAYTIDGDAPFRPVQVFDDGTHTFVRMPEKLQELPALFGVEEDSKEVQLVNYAPQPPYLVVPRTMRRFVLKLGRAEVTVTKQADRASWFGGR